MEGFWAAIIAGAASVAMVWSMSRWIGRDVYNRWGGEGMETKFHYVTSLPGTFESGSQDQRATGEHSQKPLGLVSGADSNGSNEPGSPSSCSQSVRKRMNLAVRINVELLGKTHRSTTSDSQPSKTQNETRTGDCFDKGEIRTRAPFETTDSHREED